ncbi:glycoside hydrolase family 65 protein [Mastigocoleus testarum]|uniref:Kojibiose phosphorylase n=1 Tax=Mastigocoleus testarum BC008 TaxID=371196 RepID=A0A0V7ZXI5_9CYAN|nr:glycosyl hydrolase family 65 protein [Mastigocoleus testarum]KST69253.1 kojibiose phosphorylase [Mastigocoleus testarum BC008]KST69293.1 kojibiose phosphorylase [Mastigocoleus testarum BC008]
MSRREPVNLPKHVYPVDPWRIVEKQYYPRFLAQMETMFSVSNGYLGMRGVSEEGKPVFENGTFINGFYEKWPIVYGEEAYGFAKTGQTIVNVTDSKIIKLYVDDECFYLPVANLLAFQRSLDMKTGTFERELLWETASGKQVSIKSTRLVSYKYKHLATIAYEVKVLNANASVVICSEMRNDPCNQSNDGDPRRAKGFKGQVLIPQIYYSKDRRIVLSHTTRNSKINLACGIEHDIETDCPYEYNSECAQDFGKVSISVDARAGVPIKVIKYISYHTSDSDIPNELCSRVERTLNRAVFLGWSSILSTQKQYLDDFWHQSDILIEGSSDSVEAYQRTTELQQAIRFNLFHVLQASARAEGTGIPAKGLSGQAYEGQYFWDTEIYLLPFLIYTAPRSAKNLLKFRYSMLDEARKRARDLNLKGALFPWRTINGEEASAYYPAGTAQYHINADIIYALKKYVEVTGDESFLYREGAEMLVETARMWVDLGFFEGDSFHIHGVTGPDEYTAVVNNNIYTNMMARQNLQYAAQTIESIFQDYPDRFASLLDSTNLDMSEVEEWKQAAAKMYIPFAEEMGINPQDDDFLNKKVWDFENTPAHKYPLLLHYHPLVIYRHQVIKQADLVLAMFLLGSEFSPELKKSNFDYYDPLTTGDSSLSASIQGVMAFEMGYLEKAWQYFYRGMFMDLNDLGGNVKDGCHMAAMGGSWMLMIYGIAGMRDDNGTLSFNPRLPQDMKNLRFSLKVGDRVLRIHMEENSASYLLEQGSELVIYHQGEEVRITADIPVIVNSKPFWNGSSHQEESRKLIA